MKYTIRYQLWLYLNNFFRETVPLRKTISNHICSGIYCKKMYNFQYEVNGTCL